MQPRHRTPLREPTKLIVQDLSVCRHHPLILLVLCAILLPGLSLAYPNPRYITAESRTQPGGLDTVAVMTCQPAPSFLKSATLEVVYIVERDLSQGAELELNTGQVCECRADKYQYTWTGMYRKGDTLRCSFTITPIGIGTIGLGFELRLDGESTRLLPFGFVIDEQGQPVLDAPLSPTEEYGLLGVLPEYLPDTVLFSNRCCQEVAVAKYPNLCIGGYMLPKPPLGKPLALHVDISPTVSLDSGLYYYIVHDRRLAVQLADTNDWPDLVMAGDSVDIQMTIQPKAPGAMRLQLKLQGYSLDPRLRAGLPPTLQGQVEWLCEFFFMFDEQRQLVGYNLRGDPRSQGRPSDIKLRDRYRLTPAYGRQRDLKNVTITSKNCLRKIDERKKAAKSKI